MTSKVDKDKKLLEKTMAEVSPEENIPNKTQLPIDDYEKQYKNLDLVDRKIRSDMLKFVFDSAKEISTKVKEGEDEKKRLRKNILEWLGLAALCSLVFAVVMIICDARDAINLSTEIFIAFFATIIAQIVSLIMIFARYASDTESLKMHKTISNKILDYLTANESSLSNEASDEEDAS